MPNITEDTSCSVAPYFKVHPGKLAEFKQLCTQFVEKTKSEPGCLYYGFTFNGDMAFCRAAYADAAAVMAHGENVGALLGEAAKISHRGRVEIHGPEAELAKLRAVMGPSMAEFFVLECAFRKV